MNKLVGKFIKKIAYSGFLNGMSDEPYLKLVFPAHVGYNLNLESPKTFNEKLQWLKLNDRKEKYSRKTSNYGISTYRGQNCNRNKQ